jgi:hypothetical protein
MKKLLFTLLACALLVSCEKNNDSTPGHNNIEYDGRSFDVHVVEHKVLTSPGGDDFPYLGISTGGAEMCTFSVAMSDYLVDAHIEATPSAGMAFSCGDNVYFSSIPDELTNPSGDIIRGAGVWGPRTYTPENRQVSEIVGGHFTWNVDGETAEYYLNLTFKDGKTAKAHGKTLLSDVK